MLAVRYMDKNEEHLNQLSDISCEQITDDDIMELLGKSGVGKELRRVINIFQSETEFVDMMSKELIEGESEIYMQDEFDETDSVSSNNAYVVFSAEDISRLLDVNPNNCRIALMAVSHKLEKLYAEKELFRLVTPTTLLYMIYNAMAAGEKYSRCSTQEVVDSNMLLKEIHLDKSSSLVDLNKIYWMPTINNYWAMRT